MLTAKLFENGRSQAVRLPKDCRFAGSEVLAHKIGDVVLLMPKTATWETFLAGINLFSDDYMADERAQGELDARESL